MKIDSTTIDGLMPSGRSYDKVVLIIDGDLIEDSTVFTASGTRLCATIDDKCASARLMQRSFSELREHFQELELRFDTPVGDISSTVLLGFYNYRGEPDEHLLASIDPQLGTWSKPWSFNQYFSTFCALIPALARSDIRLSSEDHLMRSLHSQGIELNDFNANMPISQLVGDLVECVREIHEKAERELTENLHRGSLVTYFVFPPAVKVASEQYLQYFIQFLEDLGIEADSEISSDAGRVLFSVTPRSGEEALATIKEALSVYLDLPARADIGGFDLSADPAANQLRANVLHLQSQLMMAHGMLQLSQATVSMQATQLAMFQGAQMVQNGNGQLRQIETPARTTQTESEPLLGDSIRVTKLKWARVGLEIDLPTLLRSLKRRLPGGRS